MSLCHMVRGKLEGEKWNKSFAFRVTKKTFLRHSCTYCRNKIAFIEINSVLGIFIVFFTQSTPWLQVKHLVNHKINFQWPDLTTVGCKDQWFLSHNAVICLIMNGLEQRYFHTHYANNDMMKLIMDVDEKKSNGFALHHHDIPGVLMYS